MCDVESFVSPWFMHGPHAPAVDVPVSCRTKNIPLPSSTLLLFLNVRIPSALFGLGRSPIVGFDGLTLRSCFVGLMLRVGGSVPPPPVVWRASGSLPPPMPVNWRASVVVPVVCWITFVKGLDPEPDGSGTFGDTRVGEDCGEARRAAFSRSCV